MTRPSLYRGQPRIGRNVVVSVVASVVVGAAVLGAGACAKAPPPRCPEEGAADADVVRDARVRVTTTTLPTDPTSGGRLSGPAFTGPRAYSAVLLLDYSGSMFGGYDRPAQTSCPRCQAQGTRRNAQPYFYADPQFRDFVAGLLDAVTPPGSSVGIRPILFNRSLWRFTEGKATALTPATMSTVPTWTASTMTGPALSQALAQIPSDPFRATGDAANETHIKPALQSAVQLALSTGDEGLIFLVTDNIADQSGGGVTADDARRNLEFYEYLKQEPRLQLVYAYPIHDAEKCTWLCGSSLFVYALQVSKRQRADTVEVDRLSGGHLGGGAANADGILWNGDVQRLAAAHAGRSPANIAGVPLRLKPMDLNAVNVSFERTPEGKLRPLRCARSAEFGDTVPCVASLVVTNTLRHERIDSARLLLEGGTLLPHTKDSAARVRWASAVCKGTIKATKATASVDDDGAFVLGPIDPGKQQQLQVKLLLPAVTVAATTIGDIVDVAFADAIVVEGPMTAKVMDVRTSLLVPVSERDAVYGAKALPRIFTDRSEAEVAASFPVVAVVNNDGKVAAWLLLGGLLLLLLVVGTLMFILQPAYCTLLVDGSEHDRYRLIRFSSRKVELRSVLYGRVKRGVGAPTFVPVRGAQARRTGAAWAVTPPAGSEARLELRQGRGQKRQAAASGF